MTLPSAHETLRVVSLFDAALDASKMDLVAYAKTRDPGLVVENPGEKATWFHLRPVDSLTFQMVVQSVASRDAEQRIRAFQMAVDRVENLVKPDGVRAPIYLPSDEQRLFGHAYKTMADAQLADFAPAYIDEVGEVAYRRGFFPGGCVDTLPVPPMWLSICRQRYVLAAASPAIASDPEAPKAKQPGEAAPECDGAKDTAATAPAP